MSFREVEERMEGAVGRIFPGAVLLVRDGNRLFYLRAFGRRSADREAPPMEEDTIFDLSSLTKPLATSVAAMLLVRDGRMGLDERVSRLFPGFAVHGKNAITYRHLLSHCSGLPAWRPYYKEILRIERKEARLGFLGSQAAKEWVFGQVERERLEAAPGESAIYSDLGFMMLGAAVEAMAGVSLDRFCQDRIFRPLGLRTTTFIDIGPQRAKRSDPITGTIAPTERCPWRKRVVCGEVHDDNAYAMGGVAGHAGLFSCAREIDALLCRLVRCWEGKDELVPRTIVREFWTVNGIVPGSTWGLGWDSPAPRGSAAGSSFSKHTVGHLGFTGTSFWVDLERSRHMILLTNRVHPRRDNEGIRELRPVIHDLVNEALDG